MTTVLVFLVFFLFFLSICLSLSVCVSMHLFTINLNFLKPHNSWLAQLVYVSLVSGLKLKNYKLRIKCLGILPKKTSGRLQCQGLGQNSLFSNNHHLLVLLDLCVERWFCEMFVFCLFSLLSVFIPGCEQLHWRYMLEFF